jgi:hypothetical protein
MVITFRIINTIARVSIAIAFILLGMDAVIDMKDYHEAMVILEIEKVQMLHDRACPTDFYEFPDEEKSL